MIRRGLKRSVAVVAVAREFACFVWGMMTGNIAPGLPRAPRCPRRPERRPAPEEELAPRLTGQALLPASVPDHPGRADWPALPDPPCQPQDPPYRRALASAFCTNPHHLPFWCLAPKQAPGRSLDPFKVRATCVSPLAQSFGREPLEDLQSSRRTISLGFQSPYNRVAALPGTVISRLFPCACFSAYCTKRTGKICEVLPLDQPCFITGERFYFLKSVIATCSAKESGGHRGGILRRRAVNLMEFSRSVLWTEVCLRQRLWTQEHCLDKAARDLAKGLLLSPWGEGAECIKPYSSQAGARKTCCSPREGVKCIDTRKPGVCSA